MKMAWTTKISGNGISEFIYTHKFWVLLALTVLWLIIWILKNYDQVKEYLEQYEIER